MAGDFIDTFRTSFSKGYTGDNSNMKLVETDYGKIRVFDSQGNKPVIISAPDGPNVIEHHKHLIQKLSDRFRVICFEFPGFGFSYPTSQYDYSINKSANIIIDLMDILKIERATLSFSCANGFYAIKTAEIVPDRIQHLFLAQTPSIHSMGNWVTSTIPKIITVPILGQLTNSFLEKKFAKNWYKYALPKGQDISHYQTEALKALKHGGCFCLSGLVQGLSKDMNSKLGATGVSATLTWGKKDFTHRKTDERSILEHLPKCEIIEFKNCGHFPELEDTNSYVKLINERLN